MRIAIDYRGRQVAYSRVKRISVQYQLQRWDEKREGQRQAVMHHVPEFLAGHNECSPHHAALPLRTIAASAPLSVTSQATAFISAGVEDAIRFPACKKPIRWQRSASSR